MIYRLTFYFLFICSSLFAQLNVVADRTTALYESNEPMHFLVTSDQNGPVSYKILYDRFVPLIESGTLNMTAGTTLFIPYSHAEPDIVYIEVIQNGHKSFGAAAFDPFDIQPIGTPPANLDQYWNQQKNNLAQLSLGLEIDFYESHEYSNTFEIKLNNIDGRKVYGLLSVPDTPGPHAAILTLPPFGNGPNVVIPEHILAERVGALSMSISIHNAPVDQVDPIGYETGDSNHPDSIYYRYALLGAIQAINYLETRNDYNGFLAVNGVSQGAGLSYLLAGIEERVNLLAQSNAALCQHQGILDNKASGFPYYIERSRTEENDPVHEAATIDAIRYYDAVHLNKNIHFPTYHIISYEDTITPSATVFAAYNQIIAPKILLHARELGHQHPNEYNSLRRYFYRRFMPAPLNPSWPFPEDFIGYQVDAGPDIILENSNSSVTLNAIVQLEQNIRTDFPARWEMIEGPGIANFNEATLYNPTVSFSTPGSYLLRFTALDQYPQEEEKFYTVQDYVRVTVEGTTANEAVDFTQHSLQLFPTPTSDLLYVKTESTFDATLQVFDNQGKKVLSKTNQSWKDGSSIQLDQLESGVFWIQFIAKNKIITKKAILIK